MVDEDTYCIDVLTQISAATKALQAVAVGLLEDHLRHCVVRAAAEGDADPEDQGGERGDRPANPVLIGHRRRRRRSRRRSARTAGRG
jgi:Metal-sensitive transcriptional repressor